MASTLLAIACSFAFCLYLFYLAGRYKSIRTAIYIGGGLRLLMAWVIGLRLIEIPGTTSDARAFESRARTLSELSWMDIIATLDPSSSHFISSIAGLIYKGTLPNPVVLNIVNASFSVFLIILSYRLASALFGAQRAKVAAWIISLFPFAVLYGSVFRREVFGSVFFMIGLLSAAAWSVRKSPATLIKSVSFFILSSFFHGGFIAAVFGLFIVVLKDLFSYKNLRAKSFSNQFFSAVVGLMLMTSIAGAGIMSGVEINKIGSLDAIDVGAALEYRIEERVSEGGSSYPDFLRGVDPFSNPLVIPGRVVYFLFSPFPWDIRSVGHILGMFATITFAYVGLSIHKSRGMIFANRKALTVFIIVLVTILVFAVSIDNIGTSIRHRTKFIYALVALCGVPVFGRFFLRSRA